MIAVNEPLLNGNEKKYLGECIDSGWISSEGPFVKKFEEAYSSFIGTKFSVAVSSGTAALEVALYAAGVSPNDEVIIPSFTIVSCIVACLRLGARPILVDIDPETWTMDVNQVSSKIGINTKVVMPVHIYGHPVDMDPLFRLQKSHDFFIVEDAAEAHGAEYFSKERGNVWLQCGNMGDIAATSFYANKIITTGEGGMVTTSDSIMRQRALSYRNLCFGDVERFCHAEIGYNFRMTNLQAAVGLAQMEQSSEFVRKKRQLGVYYRERLAAIKGIRFAPNRDYARSVYWMYSIEIDSKVGITADTLREELRGYGIGTRPFFRGLHTQPFAKNQGLFLEGHYPNTEHAYKYGLYLPSSLSLTRNQIDEVCDSVELIINRFSG